VPLVGLPSLVRKQNPEPVSASRPTGRRERLSGVLAWRLPAARATGLFVLVALTAFLAACSGDLPDGNQPVNPAGNLPGPGIVPIPPVTQAGQATMNLYLVTLVIAVIVFVIVEGLLLLITLRFRRKAGDDTLPKQTHGSNPLEILWTIIPAITVTALFIGAFITLNEEEAHAANPTLTIDVTGFQWQWTFAYEDQGLKFTGTGREGPVMALPINETVHIRLHAADVIHSFYVPQFLYKKDVVPGRTNEFDVVVQQAGTFSGQCAEFCGTGHADMHFTVQAMERAEFDSWVTQQQQQASAPPASQAPAAPGAPGVQVSSISVTAGFDPNTLSVAANQPWTVQLTNQDPAVPHNFSIRNVNGADWIGQPNAEGGATANYNPPALAAGSYEFFCSLHPNMKGTLNVQ
jgi:cytochrome c oxidase subunit 2